MSSTSDNIRRLAAFVAFLLPSLAFGQDLGVRVDSAAYTAARQSPDSGVYFYVSWEPAAVGPNLNTTITSMRYVWGRPASYSTVSRFGFQEGSGSVTSRYILADGTSFILANSETNFDSILTNINQNLSRFGLASTSEREAAIRNIDPSYRPSPEPVNLIDTSQLMNQLFRGLIPFLILAITAAVSLLALRLGVEYLFKLHANSKQEAADSVALAPRDIAAPSLNEVLASYDVSALLAAGNSRPQLVNYALDQIESVKEDYLYQYDSLTHGDIKRREKDYLRAYVIANSYYNLRARSREEKLVIGEMYEEYRLDRDKRLLDYWYDVAITGRADFDKYNLKQGFKGYLRGYEEPYLVGLAAKGRSHAYTR